MSVLQNKIDFVALVSVKNANPNGDPLNGNSPRADYDGHGVISDVCIKRKIRNRMQDEGKEIFVKMDERSDDGCKSLSERAEPIKKIKGKEAQAKAACEKWLDVRAFGQVFAYKGKSKGEGVSIGVRGPVSLHQATSIDPVQIEDMQITKSVNGETGKKEGTDNVDNAEKSSDTMGMKHFVRFGLYKVKGSINVQLAEKTGFSEEDADVVKECLRTLFVNDTSSARPDGAMEVCKLYWWKHNNKIGQYSSAKVHESVDVKCKSGVDIPSSFEDYDVDLIPLEGLEPEIIDGI